MGADVEGREELIEEIGQGWRAAGECSWGVMSDWAGGQASSAPAAPPLPISLSLTLSRHCLPGGLGLALLGWSFHAAHRGSPHR